MVARTASVKVSLLDGVSGPARIVGNALRGLRGDMNALKGARLGIDKQIAVLKGRIDETRGSLLRLGIAGVGAAYGLKRVMKSGVEFESVLMDIRQKADLSADATSKMAQRIREMGPQVNKSALEVAKGVDFLMGAGLDPDRAMAMMPAIGKAATAYRAEIDDLAKAGFAAMDNLKVRTEDFGRSLDIMAQAGKEGNFELKDMATYFPQLTAAAEALGMRGNSGVAKLAAALQIARKGAGDASSAATNTANLMQKIVSPETTKKFKKLGVDIRAELKKVQKEGGDPFIMIAEQTKKALKGDLSKLGDVFEDAQVQQFLRPLIANLELYKQIRDKSGGAAGVVDQDYKLRMETFQARLDRLMNALDTLAMKITDSLVPYLGALADALTPLVQGLGEWVSANQQLAAAALAAAAGLMALAGLRSILKIAAFGAGLLSFKGLRGLLNYLAPKGGATPGAAAGGATGGAAGAGAAAGKVGTATKPGTFSGSQLKAMGESLKATAPGTALGRLVGGLKNGLVGGLLYSFGTGAIDAAIDAAPKPDMPKGYNPKAEAELGIIGRIKRMMSGYTEGPNTNVESSTSPRLTPIDPADLERARRAQDEARRDPEGARGRAMMSLSGGASAGFDAGASVGDKMREGLESKKPDILGAFDGILAALKAKAQAAGISVDVAARLSMQGLRGIHADAGIAP